VLLLDLDLCTGFDLVELGFGLGRNGFVGKETL